MDKFKPALRFLFADVCLLLLVYMLYDNCY